MARRETNSEDLPIAPIPSVDITDGKAESEQIKLVDKPLSTEYMDEIAFMEELVQIRLEKPQQEEKSVLAYPFSVNGRTEWVPTDVPWTIKRKYLGVMLGAQPFKVSTETFKPGEREEKNLMHRNATRRFSVSILHDPSPRGQEWVRQMCLQG